MRRAGRRCRGNRKSILHLKHHLTLESIHGYVGFMFYYRYYDFFNYVNVRMAPSRMKGFPLVFLGVISPLIVGNMFRWIKF